MGVLLWRGDAASKLIALNGLLWPVVISATQIQIGCQCHSIERWDSFGDAQIAAMDGDAPEFWTAHKALIMSIAKGIE